MVATAMRHKQNLRFQGTFDPETQSVTLHDKRQPGEQDWLDLAAVHTFLNHGAVYAMPLEEMPADEPVAAIFRD
ncbi:MAG: hypothetical protein ACK2UI_03650 [Anaerolineae bacterium]